MDQKLTFRLDNPTIEKWELYKGLSASIDKIASDMGLITVNRIFCESDYTCHVESKCPDNETIFKCFLKVTNLLSKHGITVTCISAMQYAPPEQIDISMDIILAEGNRDSKSFKKWESIAKIIDAECKIRGVYIKRVKDPENFRMTLFASYTNHFDWSYIGFFAGHLFGLANIKIILSEPVMDIKTEDILDEITHVTGRHKQLSFLDFQSQKRKRG
jgi:hypothetical protein